MRAGISRDWSRKLKSGFLLIVRSHWRARWLGEGKPPGKGRPEGAGVRGGCSRGTATQPTRTPDALRRAGKEARSGARDALQIL